jgi:thiamine kinase-like enzyme
MGIEKNHKNSRISPRLNLSNSRNKRFHNSNTKINEQKILIAPTCRMQWSCSEQNTPSSTNCTNIFSTLKTNDPLGSKLDLGSQEASRRWKKYLKKMSLLTFDSGQILENKQWKESDGKGYNFTIKALCVCLSFAFSF